MNHSNALAFFVSVVALVASACGDANVGSDDSAWTTCPPGESYNPVTKACENPGGPAQGTGGGNPTCPPGESYNPVTMACENPGGPAQGTGGGGGGNPPCPPGESYNPVTKACENPGGPAQ